MKCTMISILLSTMPLLTLTAQYGDDPPSNDWQQFIYFEGGMIYPEGAIKESVSIRQNISYYYVNQYSDGYVSSETSGYVFGIRYGYFFPRFKSGISTGIRFTGLEAEISGYTSDISDFFYLRYSMQDSDTKFARVTSMSESNYFLTKPLEVHIIPFTYKNLSLYAKAGVEYSVVNLKSGTDIQFRDAEMEPYENEILGNISGDVNKRYSTLYGAVGIQLGREDRPNLMFEVYLPSLFLTRNNFALIDVDYYEGFRLAAKVPLSTIK
jgi:hypothetical protein